MKKMKANYPDKIDEALSRGVAEVYPDKKSLEKVLRSDKKIRLYQGFDPSMPNLHLGNMVGLLKLKQFQDLGHEVIFLVGDFTGMVGDPDKMSTRKPLTKKQVEKNSQNWKTQAGNFLNFKGNNPAKILYNSQWLSKLTFSDLIKIASNLTHQQIIKRDMFQKRLKENRQIYFHELLYPIMQGYDCVHLDVDLEVGGADQLFNILVGRDLMRKIKDKEKLVLTTKLLVDSSGQKAGKTSGNALFLNAAPNDIFGGIMAFSDELIAPGFELLTTVNWEEVQKIQKQIKDNPMTLKKRLAFEVVKLICGEKKAVAAQSEFERVFQKGQQPENLPVVMIKDKSLKLVDLLVKTKLAPSRSEAKRLIRQGAVDINNKKYKDENCRIKVKNGIIIRAGKKKFVRIAN